MLLNLYLIWATIRGVSYDEAASHYMVWYLRRKGVKIGRACWISHRCRIEAGTEIGDNCTLTNCTILTHDASMGRHLGKTRRAGVKIHRNCYVGYGAIVLPGVKIGPDSIVGAGSVVAKDVPPRVVVAGAPARQICDLQTFLDKHRQAISGGATYDACTYRCATDDATQ